ncbi:MAG: RdgB/HAM1 family non-canonical purine NTP pyrophosphatase [Lentisphaerae bacterium]|nr:RdgB/HAM1 family non-canonical purine NTP pyrophosphatase [Lentisphaerota bacterium]
MKLLIASRNPHKLREIRAILNLPGLEIIGANEIEGLPEVVEDGQSFQANAVKKAVSLALRCKLWTLADDSGLEVEALNGAPGVRSARFAGPPATLPARSGFATGDAGGCVALRAGEPVNYAANNTKLLKLLELEARRSARFVCVIVLASPSGRAQMVEGVCRGRILSESRGEHGFGYDPVFVPDNYEQTFAQMDPALKNRISHRALALQRALETWGELLGATATACPRRLGSARDWPARNRKKLTTDGH